MQKDLTDITMIVDYSGSMASIKSDAEGGINTFVEQQQAVYKWQFTFLAANQDAFAEGASLGIDADGIANYSPNQIASAQMGTSSKVSRMRRSASAGETLDNKFTDEERRSAVRFHKKSRRSV